MKRCGPKFTDNSAVDNRIDHARFGNLMFTKVKQFYTNNLELNAGGQLEVLTKCAWVRALTCTATGGSC
eukprot:COSAG05_NODE_661_length_8043_cov_22.502014_1_plen_69_part_00